MSKVNEITEVLRIPINAIAEAQKNLQAMKNFSDRKEALAKEFSLLALTSAEASILGANELCTSLDHSDEMSLSLAVDGMKQIINSINPSPNTVS